MDKDVETKELPKIETREIVGFSKLWGRKPVHKASRLVWPKENHTIEAI